MIDIYAIYMKDYPGRTKIQSVPAGSQDNINILNPTTKGDIGNATSMDFSVQSGTPYYGQFLQMRTYIQVDYDGDTIFYGRVITVSHDFYGGQKLHCEGAIAFLNDTYYPAEKKDTQKEKTTLERITELLNNHNQQVGDPLKRIFVGEVPGNYSNLTAPEQRIKLETRKFGQTSWNTTKSALEDLKSHFGGAFRIRYEAGVDTTDQNQSSGIGDAVMDGPNVETASSSGKICYLDWLNHYYRSTVRQQTIEVGRNLIDVSRSTELSNIFTAVIPIGKASSGDNAIYLNGYRNAIHGDNNYFPVPNIRKAAFPAGTDTTYLYTDNELESGYHHAEDYRTAIDQYGMIFKTVQFDEAHSQEELFKRTTEWIKENYQGGVTTFSVKAIDLHLIGENPEKILLGDRVRVRYPVGTNSTVSRIEERTLTCTSVSLDLFNPDNNSYTFGIPANMLGKTYGDESQKKKKTSSPGGGRNDDDNEPEDVDPWLIWAKSVRERLTYLKYWKKTNGGVEAGPNLVVDQSTVHGDYLTMLRSHDSNGNNNWLLLVPPSGPTIEYGYVDGRKQSWYMFPKNPSTGRSTYTTVKIDGETYSDLYKFIDVVEKNHLFEFIFYEHGLDLRGNANAGDSSKPPISPRTGVDYSHLASLGADAVGGAMQEIFKFFGQGSPDEPVGPNDPLVQVFTGTARDLIGTLFGNGSFSIEQQNTDGTQTTLAQFATDGVLSLLDPNGDLFTVQETMQTTRELADELEAMGVTVTAIDTQVTLIGRVVSDPVSGLVKQVADQGRTITAITSDVIQLGNRLSDETAALTADLATLGRTVTNISADVVTIGTDLSAETEARIRDIAAQRQTITAITSDVTIIEGRLEGHDAKFQTIETDYLKTNQLYSKIADLDFITVGGITEDSNHPANATLTNFYGYDFILRSGSQYAPNQSLKDSLYDLKIERSGNTYTLSKKTIGNASTSNWVEVGTFSRATTLGGTWSGSVLNVAATPQNTHFYVGFGGSYGDHDVEMEITTNGSATKSSIAYSVEIPIKASSLNSGQTAPTSRYTKTLTSSISSLLQSKTVSASVQEALSVTPDSSYVGLKSVTVNRIKVSARTATPTLSAQYIYPESGNDYLSYVKVNAATDVYNAGAPSSLSLGSKYNNMTWNFTITKGDGGTVAKTLDCTNIYNDARSGYYTQAQYNARFNSGHDSVVLAEVDLNGSSSSTSSSKPATALSKTASTISGYKWFKLSSGTWKNLGSFSISTGATHYTVPIYYYSGGSYHKITKNTLCYSDQ